MGPIGFQEMILIFVVALLIFGPKKLPELGRSFGKGVSEFKKASAELRSTFQREMDNIEQETKAAKKVADDVKSEVKSQYYDDNDYHSDYDSKPYGEPDAAAKTSSASPASTADDKATAHAVHETDSTGVPLEPSAETGASRAS
jgi:sec-independent protein translocase protein TatA